MAVGMLAACGSDEDVASKDMGEEPVMVDIEELTSSAWSLRFGGAPSGDVVLVDGFPVTITFDADGTITGTASCNGYGGTYTLDFNDITLSDLAVQERACEADVQAAESTFIEGLLDVNGINLLDDELVLSGSGTELIFGRTSVD